MNWDAHLQSLSFPPAFFGAAACPAAACRLPGLLLRQGDMPSTRSSITPRFIVMSCLCGSSLMSKAEEVVDPMTFCIPQWKEKASRLLSQGFPFHVRQYECKSSRCLWALYHPIGFLLASQEGQHKMRICRQPSEYKCTTRAMLPVCILSNYPIGLYNNSGYYNTNNSGYIWLYDGIYIYIWLVVYLPL